MQNFSRKLITEWRNLRLPFSDKNIIIAVSGGADSCALAFALSDLLKRKKIRNNFTIAHFNHKLRGDNSNEDADFVKEFANNLGFNFISETAKQGEIGEKGNLEQNARFARYKFLNKVAKDINAFAVLTAHTMNDQAETFLLNLLRGSGIQGLTAMNAVRKLTQDNEVLLARPILNWAKREDTEEFVRANNLQYRHDKMNDDTNYKRVLIRKELIPSLKKINPKIVETLANSSNIIANESNLIGELILENNDFQDLINSSKLKIAELKNLSDAMLYAVLRKWLLNKRGDLRNVETVHLKAIKKLINSRKSGKVIELPNFETIKKLDGKLIFQGTEVEK